MSFCFQYNKTTHIYTHADTHTQTDAHMQRPAYADTQTDTHILTDAHMQRRAYADTQTHTPLVQKGVFKSLGSIRS